MAYRSILAFGLGAALVLQLPLVPVVAQAVTGSIAGTITDIEKNAVVNAKVTLSVPGADGKPQVKATTATNDVGHYSFSNLPAGAYEIRVETLLFVTETRSHVIVGSLPQTTTDFRLRAAEGCDEFTVDDGLVSDSDKAEIVRLTLEDALVKKSLPDLNMLTERKDDIIVSTKNIKSSWLPNLPPYRLVLWSPTQIQLKADRDGDIPYLSFATFKVKGSCIAVTLANSWAVGKNSGMGYLSGGGSAYEYRRTEGKWIGKILRGWIS